MSAQYIYSAYTCTGALNKNLSHRSQWIQMHDMNFWLQTLQISGQGLDEMRGSAVVKVSREFTIPTSTLTYCEERNPIVGYSFGRGVDLVVWASVCDHNSNLCKRNGENTYSSHQTNKKYGSIFLTQQSTFAYLHSNTSMVILSSFILNELLFCEKTCLFC